MICSSDENPQYIVADLEVIMRVPWNPPFKDELVQKSLLYLAQPNS